MGNSRTKNSALTMAMSSMRQLLTILLTLSSAVQPLSILWERNI